MDDRVSGRQSGAWAFCALSVPAVLSCAGRSWNWVLLGCAAAAAFFVLAGCLRGKSEPENLTVLMPRALGRYAGRVLLGFGGIYTLLAAAQTAASAGAAFPDETAQLAGPAILVLAALVNRKGAARAAKVCGVVTLILAALYTIRRGSAARQVRPQWLAPWGNVRQTAEILPSMLAPACLWFLPGRTEQAGKGWLALLVLCPAVVAGITSGCLSPRLTQQLAQPFYTVSQSLSVLDVMERFEPLVSSALLMGLFAMESLLIAAAGQQLSGAIGRPLSSGWAIYGLCAAAFVLRFVSSGITAAAWGLGAAIFWGIVPLLTQLIVAIK